MSLYKRRLLNEPEITKAVANLFWGVEEPQIVTLEFSNAHGEFTDLLNAGEEFIGRSIPLFRYEPLDETPKTFEAYGTITSFNILPDVASFQVILSRADPIFQTKLPQKVYEIDDWSESRPNIINPSKDLGRPYNLCFGYCKKVPLIYVHANYTNNYYDYIIGAGAIESNNSNKSTTVNVYRKKRLIANTEYYVHGGETTIQYTDASFGMAFGNANPYIKDGISYAFIRFKVMQRDESGNLYDFHADVRGLKLGGDSTATRNFAKIIQYLLNNAYWGLNQSVNSASFITAISNVSDLYCDGHISKQIIAQDVFDYMQRACRGHRYKNESGEWCLTIDVYQSVVSASFGLNVSGDYGKIVEITRNGLIDESEAMKTYTLKYRHNEWTNEYIMPNKRDILNFGEEVIEENPFVRDHTTADKMTCYIQKLSQVGKRRLEFTVGMEGRLLQEFNPIKANIPLLGIDDTFSIRAIRKSLNQFKLETIKYSADIYTYTAGTIPSDENADDETDYSFTPPSSPTDVAVVSEGTYQSSDGTTLAYKIIKGTAPATNFTTMLFGYRKTTETALPYTWIEGQLIDAITRLWEFRNDALVPGISYDYAVMCRNSNNQTGYTDSAFTTLTSQVAAGDTTAPSTPTGLAATADIGKVVLEWNENSEADLTGYEVFINTSNSIPSSPNKFVAATKNKVSGSKNKTTYDNLEYGVTYYFWIKAVDYTGNKSTATSSVNAAPIWIMTDDIYGDQITYLKRQQVNSYAVVFTDVPAGGVSGGGFAHGLGRIPLGTPSTNNPWLIPYIYGLDDANVGLAMHNFHNVDESGTLTAYYW